MLQRTHLEIRLGDLRFPALAAGPDDGELVLLLHGFPQTSAAWEAQLPALAGAGFRAVAPDQRGYSPTARPRATSAYRLDHLVGDALGMADDLGAERFHVVGHDWGGAVAWALGADHADRVRSLTVLSTPHPRAMLAAIPRSLQLLQSSYIALFRTPVVAETLLGLRGAAPLAAMLRRSGLPPDTVEAYRAAMCQPGALRAALSWYRANGGQVARVGKVGVPTLYVWGRGDPALGRTAAEATADWVTGPYTFAPVDAGHWLPERHAAVLEPLLLGHLAG